MTPWAWRDGAAGFLEIAGGRLEAASFGASPEAAPTLVLLHEGLGCVARWRDFPQRLAAETGCGVFVYSRFGYGASATISLPRPLDYLTREARDVLPEVVEAIGLRRGVWLGHSDGATLAAIHAGVVADSRLSGVILMAPHFFTEPIGLAAIRALRDAYEQGELRRRLARHHHDVDAAFRGWCDAWLDPDFARWTVGDVIESWRVPALAIQGRDDGYGTLAQIREIETRARSPVEVAIIEGCGHHPHLEAGDAMLAAVASFVRRLGG